MSFLQQHPSFRFLWPMLGGIVCGDYLYSTEWASICLPVFVGICFILLLSFVYRRYVLFGVLTFVFFFFLGFSRVSQQMDGVAFPFSGKQQLYQVLLEDEPEEKEKTIQCQVLLQSQWEKKEWIPLESRFLLYIAKDSLSRSLARGDVLWVYTQLQPVAQNHLPLGFDYARYLRHQGVSGTAYVPAGKWKLQNHQLSVSWKQKALDVRERILAIYRRLGIASDELAVLSALTLGYKEALGEDIQETYSRAGASHVLALSGLHIGFIYGLLLFFFLPLWKRWVWLKVPLSIVIIFILWIFAFLTGLSVSVVRAVVMCSLFILLSWRTEKPLTMDILLAAAFLMLLYQPFWVFDVGFQLSFAAVASILLFYPPLRDSLSIHSKILRKIWSLLSVSIAAQLGTAPLVLFYFSHFPTHFLLTNLWVIPLVSLIMYSASILLLLTPFPLLQQWFAQVVESLVHFQNAGLHSIEQLPYASLETGHWELWKLLFCYWLFYLFYIICKRCTAWNIMRFLGISLIGVLLNFGFSMLHRPQKGISFYATHGKVAVHCLTDGPYSWMVSVDSVSDEALWLRTLEPYWSQMRLAEPTWVKEDYQSEHLLLKDQILVYDGKKVCFLTNDHWLHVQSSFTVSIDYLLVVRGYKGGLKELTDLFQLHTVVIAPNLSAYYRKRILEESHALGLTCVELQEQGMQSYTW